MIRYSWLLVAAAAGLCAPTLVQARDASSNRGHGPSGPGKGPGDRAPPPGARGPAPKEGETNRKEPPQPTANGPASGQKSAAAQQSPTTLVPTRGPAPDPMEGSSPGASVVSVPLQSAAWASQVDPLTGEIVPVSPAH